MAKTPVFTVNLALIGGRRGRSSMQRRRVVRAFACLVAVLVLGGPVSAHDFTGSEEEERTLQCPKNGQSVPSNQEGPDANECQGTDTTYRGKVWTNDVKCNSGGTDAQAAKVYTTNNGTSSGGVGVCNDRNTIPVQGRFVIQASQADGVTAYADGDKDNSNEAAKGFARLDAKSSGATVRCGDDNGRRDASHPQATDGQDDCG